MTEKSYTNVIDKVLHNLRIVNSAYLGHIGRGIAPGIMEVEEVKGADRRALEIGQQMFLEVIMIQGYLYQQCVQCPVMILVGEGIYTHAVLFMVTHHMFTYPDYCFHGSMRLYLKL